MSKFRDFITDPHPTLAPWTDGDVTLSRTGKLTCEAPSFEAGVRRDRDECKRQLDRLLAVGERLIMQG